MSGVDVTLTVSVFLASAVEAVEALTVVLAVGSTRSWRSSLLGAGAALLGLSVAVGVFGSALAQLPLDFLRAFVGAFLLLFGLQWLRKAILRGCGAMALHDEIGEFEREAELARAGDSRRESIDRYSFTVSFKAVLLEGLEVVVIVIGLGASQGQVGLAAAAAVASVLLVCASGFALRAPLARVPENLMKLAVGVTLSSFGIFWSAEGVGARWPLGEAFLLVIVALVLVWSLLAIRMLRARGARLRAQEAAATGALAETARFFLGDDRRSVLVVLTMLGATAALASISAGWYVLPLGTLALLSFSVSRRVELPFRARR
jgi:uncharacterized membrane protein